MIGQSGPVIIGPRPKGEERGLYLNWISYLAWFNPKIETFLNDSTNLLHYYYITSIEIIILTY